MAISEWYDHTTFPATRASLSSSAMRSELAAIQNGISAKLPDLSGNGGKIIAVNAGATALEAVTTASGILTFLATPSSANLRSAITDETGTGALVFGTSPTFTTSIITPRVTSAAASNLLLGAAGLDNWYIDGSTRHFKPFSDNAFDFGAAAERVRTAYIGTSIVLDGGQIKFPATQSASADANTLDDYEEGTFTPTLTFGGLATGMTFTTRQGEYTKIGRVVAFQITIELSAKGSSTGNVVMGGLPFACGAGINYPSFAVTGIANLALITETLKAYGGNGVTTINLTQGFTANTVLTDANFTNTSLISVSGTYFV